MHGLGYMSQVEITLSQGSWRPTAHTTVNSIYTAIPQTSKLCLNYNQNEITFAMSISITIHYILKIYSYK